MRSAAIVLQAIARMRRHRKRLAKLLKEDAVERTQAALREALEELSMEREARQLVEEKLIDSQRALEETGTKLGELVAYREAAANEIVSLRVEIDHIRRELATISSSNASENGFDPTEVDEHYFVVEGDSSPAGAGAGPKGAIAGAESIRWLGGATDADAHADTVADEQKVVSPPERYVIDLESRLQSSEPEPVSVESELDQKNSNSSRTNAIVPSGSELDQKNSSSSANVFGPSSSSVSGMEQRAEEDDESTSRPSINNHSTECKGEVTVTDRVSAEVPFADDDRDEDVGESGLLEVKVEVQREVAHSLSPTESQDYLHRQALALDALETSSTGSSPAVTEKKSITATQKAHQPSSSSSSPTSNHSPLRNNLPSSLISKRNPCLLLVGFPHQRRLIRHRPRRPPRRRRRRRRCMTTKDGYGRWADTISSVSDTDSASSC